MNQPSPTPDLPHFINPDLWADFLKLRKEIRHKVTPTVHKYLMKKLQRFNDNGQNVNRCIEQPLEEGWRGIYHVRKKPITDSLTVPRDNDDLWDWAKEHKFPDPKDWETNDQYRQRLQGLVRQRA